MEESHSKRVFKLEGNSNGNSNEISMKTKKPKSRKKVENVLKIKVKQV